VTPVIVPAKLRAAREETVEMKMHSKEVKTTGGHPMEKVVSIVRPPASAALSTTSRSSARLLRVSGCLDLVRLFARRPTKLNALRLWRAFS
jgi:hypothetical protein